MLTFLKCAKLRAGAVQKCIKKSDSSNPSTGLNSFAGCTLLKMWQGRE